MRNFLIGAIMGLLVVMLFFILIDWAQRLAIATGACQ